MKITKLEYQKKDPNRVSVYVNDKFTAGLNINDIIKLGLYSGQELSSEELNKILADSDFGKLFNAAINFLSYRPRSEWEIKQYLYQKIKKSQSNETKSKEKTEVDDDIHQVLEKLRQIGQINDENFATWFAGQRRNFRQKANRVIKYELLKKGLDRKVIDKVLSSEENEETPSQLELATKALEKKFKNVNPLKNEDLMSLKIKMQRFLGSRGFGWDEIKDAVEKFLKRE